MFENITHNKDKRVNNEKPALNFFWSSAVTFTISFHKLTSLPNIT